jgi:hypothetical protein
MKTIEINGKTYTFTKPSKPYTGPDWYDDAGCLGCAFIADGASCEAAGNVCLTDSYVWEEKESKQ